MNAKSLSSVSFRDPAGFIYSHHGELRRQVNQVYREDYDRLLASGLYDELVQAGLLIPHQEVADGASQPELAYKVLRPERVEFISYPGEWSWSAYRDAALAALEVQRRSLFHGMTLKDCSAFNFQFHNGHPVLIDTLSFEIDRGEPWVGYRQFCEHFLAPLALMSLVDGRLGRLFRASVDGVPIDLAARLLPWRSMLRFGLAMHLHLHSSLQRKHSGRTTVSRTSRVSEAAKLGLVDSLRSTVQGLRWKRPGGEWESYYDEHSYTPAEFKQKVATVEKYLQQSRAATVWDLGANTGYFSLLACELGLRVVAFESDPACVDRMYLEAKGKGQTRLLPLVQDLANPTPWFGWENRERASIFERGGPDLVLALALVHHLALAGNQPLENIAGFFDRLAPWLVIEFVPEDDPQALSLRERTRGIHHRYDREQFELCMGRYFDILNAVSVSGSGRRLYLMRRKMNGPSPSIDFGGAGETND
jgi:hypothetical protein